MHRPSSTWLHRASLASVLLAAVLAAPAVSRAETVAIVGGTLVDVTDFGRSNNDIPDAVVVIDGGKIVAVGPASSVAVPAGARTIDGRGKFLIPGLIDGFGALRAQSFADAYLYDGVTTVYVPTILPTGGGDGETKVARDAAPAPRLFLGAPMTGYSEDGADPSDKSMAALRLHGVRLTNQQLVARIDRLAAQGYRGVTVSYDVWPDQVDTIVAQAKLRGLATLGEPAFTTYPYEIRSGIDALVHNDHYQTEFAPAAAQLARADDLSSGVGAMRAICSAAPDSGVVTDYGERLARSHTALMPTLAIEATADALDAPNPWNAPSAVLIAASDLDVPVDKQTGESGWLKGLAPDRTAHVRACAWHKEQLDGRLYALGAKFLAGSAATTYGVMPGSGLHFELALLHRIGLTPREALAAATSNFADIYGWADVGRIEPGRAGDVLLLNADPRLDVTAVDHIDTLVFDGRVVDRPSLLAAATTEPASPDAVKLVEAAWSKAFLCGDTQYLDQVLAADYMSISGAGVATGRDSEKQRALAQAAAHPCTASTVFPNPPLGVNVRGNTALATYFTHSTTGLQRSVDVFYYAGGAWRAWYSQHTPMAAR